MQDRNDLSSSAPHQGEAIHDFFGTDEIFQRVAATADEEMSKPIRLMFISGLAAGLSIGLSFYARAAVTAQVPDQPLIGNLIYPIGFLLIVIGRYQLFTENTLTPVTLVLTRIASIPTLLRIWGVVLVANMVGATLLAFFMANTSVFTPAAAAKAIDFWDHAEALSWDSLFVKGIMAGWLVASMVWLVHAARDTISRILLVVFMMFIIPSADLFHCIIGLCEAMYAVFEGEATLFTAIFEFFLPVMFGNTIGGVTLVAFLNYSMTADDRFSDRDCGKLELNNREWLFGFYTGAPMPGDDTSYRNLRTDVRAIDHIHGDPNAPITLVQYADIECPTSKDIYTLVDDLQHHTDVPLRYVYRHLPLSRRHPHAMNAAVAAEAAGRQGMFWEMLAKLFENPHHLEDYEIEGYAEDLNLDMAQFEADRRDIELRKRVDHDRDDAIENGIRRTDNLFINGKRYTGAFSVRELARAVEIAAANAETVRRTVTRRVPA
jgi:formate/nitrite transporter FocA (FNT family)/protein-disulfide isomerase